MRFTRLEQLIGIEKLHELQKKTVLVVGLGGVGGSATEALARSGFGTIIIVDKDTVDISNLNRQIIALETSIGQPKVDVMAKRIRDINPDCEVITHKLFYNQDTKNIVWNHDIDYVVDCIDTVTFKIDLIKEAKTRNIPVVSVMGTGNKFHPELLQLMPLAKTEYDPIARVLRQKLRPHVDLKTIMVVASKEQPEKVNSQTTSPSSNAFVPNTAGILAASYIFNLAIGKVTAL